MKRETKYGAVYGDDYIFLGYNAGGQTVMGVKNIRDYGWSHLA